MEHTKQRWNETEYMEQRWENGNNGTANEGENTRNKKQCNIQLTIYYILEEMARLRSKFNFNQPATNTQLLIFLEAQEFCWQW